MKLSTIALATLCSWAAYGSIEQAPPAFSLGESKVTFVDFQEASYSINYDLPTKAATVTSKIRFVATGIGLPVIDLVATPELVLLDGKDISTGLTQDPDRQTTLRILLAEVSAGEHTVEIRHRLTSNVVWSEAGVGSGFWTSDLTDRRYLEQYLPSNLEYDQYPMKLSVSVTGAQGRYDLKANGFVERIEDNEFSVTFPDFYTASSVFFHLFPEGTFKNTVQFYYPSIDGRLIPVDIYTSYDATVFAAATQTILAELEADYGPFPHEQVIIYGNAPSGGMEYAGATATSLSALGHELFHSYHARALMPANGNAGWMDEAIARWRDNRYPLNEKLSFENTRLAGRSVWTRITDRMAYTEGSAFLGWIAYRMNEKGLSFKTFLRDFFSAYKYKTVTTPLFERELTRTSGLELTADFAKYIYGREATEKSLRNSGIFAPDPNHPQFSERELQALSLPL